MHLFVEYSHQEQQKPTFFRDVSPTWQKTCMCLDSRLKKNNYLLITLWQKNGNNDERLVVTKASLPGNIYPKYYILRLQLGGPSVWKLSMHKAMNS